MRPENKKPKPAERLTEIAMALEQGMTSDELFIPDDEHGRSRLSEDVPEIPGFKIVADTGPFPMKLPRPPLRCRLGWHKWETWRPDCVGLAVRAWRRRCALCGKEKR